MASSSTSPAHKSFKYDVFLSFRGDDVRKNFVDHLYASLKRQGINTFKDDKNLQKGERIDNQLIESIQNSRFFIIIFSEKYASSSWCLDELVKIMECQKNNTEQIAHPVFYDVDPSEVRKQHESYGKALARYKEKEDVAKWKEALREAGNLVGYDVRKIADGHEAEVIKQIVSEISKKLCSSYLSSDDKLVGMETRMQDLLSCLEIGLNDVRMIGIKGMGGAGKTTLARAIFEMISIHYDGVSFVRNVRENSTLVSGLQSLQEKVLKDVLKERDITVSDVSDGKRMIENRLCGIKALVVLDDVDDMSQLEALAGALNWFKSGSRIIITTRNDQVLVAHGVEIKHNINLLSNEEAIRLFSMYAFKGDKPSESYEKLSQHVVDYASGLPLTVKVLGSRLCGQGESVWIDLLKRLEKIPLKETLDILELSYDSLEDDHKEIFLDVACLLRHQSKIFAIRIFESCGFHATYGLRVLEQRSLINIHESRKVYDDGDEYLDMHDHIQEMGRNIVRREHCDDPCKHSRLWIEEEIKDVLVNDLGTEATRCIKGFVDLDPKIIMSGIRRMKNLRVLMLESYSGFVPTDWEFDDDGQNALPKSFQANNLVLDNLKFMYLTLTKLDLGRTPNLDTLYLDGCNELVELDMSSRCPKLKFLNLRHSKLRKLDLALTPNLETLHLHGCDVRVELAVPTRCSKLKSMNAKHSKLTKLVIGPTTNLETLDLSQCDELVELDMSAGCPKLKSLNLMYSKLMKLKLGPTLNLETLNLYGWDELVELKMSTICPNLISLKAEHSKLTKLELGPTPNLETLDLSQCNELLELDMSPGCPKLKSLNLISCSKLIKLKLGLTPHLKMLNLYQCDKLLELDMSAGCRNLTYLKLMNGSKLTNFELGPTPCLETLHLDGCSKLALLDMSARYLNLRSLNLIYSKMIKLDLWLTPNLEKLYLYQCNELVELDMSVECLNLRSLNFQYCSKLTKFDLWPTPNLEALSFYECNELVELNMFAPCPKLTSLELMRCSKLTKLQLGLTPNLETLYLDGCSKLVELDMSARCLNLRSLNFRYCSRLTNFDLPATPNLEELSLYECSELELGMPVECPKLRSLNFQYCSKLRKLNLGLTPNLELLYLDSCEELVVLDMSVGCPKLINFGLMSCSKLTKLDLGPTQNLENLDLFQCSKLVELDLGLTPKIKVLNVRYCHHLEKLHMRVGCLKELTELDLFGCSSLKSFVLTKESESHAFGVSSESLDICPLDSNHFLPNISLSYLYQEQPSSSAGNLEKLIYVGSCRCSNLRNILKTVDWLPSLRELTLGCSIPYDVPNDDGKSEHVEELIFSCTGIEKFPYISYGRYLKSLKLELCTSLAELQEYQIGSLHFLEKLHLSYTPIKRLPSSICKLKRLKFLELVCCRFLEKLPEDLGELECLEELFLQECKLLRDIPNSICEMKCLKVFHLSYCAAVKKLPEEIGRVESLRELNIFGTGIRHLPQSTSLLKDLRIVRYQWHLEMSGFTFATVQRISEIPERGNS